MTEMVGMIKTLTIVYDVFVFSTDVILTFSSYDQTHKTFFSIRMHQGFFRIEIATTGFCYIKNYTTISGN